MITGSQIRAGRALVRWSADDLAIQAGVGVATIRRFESSDSIPAGQARVIQLIKLALESAGVAFIGSADDAPGVRLLKVPKND